MEAVKLLIADRRVDVSHTIDRADSQVVYYALLEDERFGICAYRDVYKRYHRTAVNRYDELTEAKIARVCAVLWCMKQVEGWGDLREPTEQRMMKQPLDWCSPRELPPLKQKKCILQ